MMSDDRSSAGALPTVEEVKRFSAERLNLFLKEKLKNIDTHLDTLKAQVVDGEAFFVLNREDLKSHEIPLGVSAKILNLVDNIQRSRPVAAIYFQCKDSRVISESCNSWTNFRELFGHLQTLFGLEGPMKDYEFIIGNKKVDLISKEDFIEFVERHKNSFRNPVKILDAKGHGSYADIIDSLPTPSKLAEPNEWHRHNGNKPVCLNPRPPTATNAVPVSLYCSVFGTFEDLCKESPKREGNTFTYNFCREMARFYSSEEARRNVASRLLSDYLSHRIEPLSLEKNRSTDGTVSIENSYREINIEYKNETCSTNSCPYLENCGYYLLFCKKQEKDGSPVTNMPCFLITIAGPTFAVYGAIFSDVAIVDPLTTTFHLLWLKNNEKMMVALSSTFRALKLSLQELDKYDVDLTQTYPRQYPSFPEVKFDEVNYNVQSNSQYGNYLLWEVTLNDPESMTDERKAYVKAAQKEYYSLEVHEFLAENEYAPAIISHTEIPGGWLLIYMEYLNDHLMLDRITHCLNRDEKNALKTKIIEVVEKMHSSQYVHGDLREGNILVCQNKNNSCDFDVKLIDFEWSGKVGTARYSHFMNHVSIRWPDGAEDGKKVMAEHDKWMLNQTLKKANLLQDSMDIEMY